ncbi:MAG: AMP-binding protein [Acidimicrobiales bacterium]|nr:AMP-binding protein [Acidimicrobiales bacterium]
MTAPSPAPQGGEAAHGTVAPALAEVPLPAADAATLLRRNGLDDDSAGRPALRFGDRVWTHRQVLEEAERFAALFRDRIDPGRPPHVGVLLDNTPDYVFALCGAGLAGAAVVGLNHTRVGEHLGQDIAHTDVQLLVTEPRHQAQLGAALSGVAVPGGVLVSERFADDLDPPAVGETLEGALADLPEPADPPDVPEDSVDRLWALLFTSGTSAAPKAVRCTQRRLLTTGNRMAMMLELGPEDVGYAAMPLFHTNSLMAGLAPALVAGASLSLARRFSASGFLGDVRRYGVTWFNYTGKLLAYLLATPEQPDDADNPVRVAFGNEGSPGVVETAAARFGIRIIDVFGSTEGAIALDRSGDRPPGSIGRLREGIAVVDEDGLELPRARFDADGRLVNAEDCVGELVNTLGVGPFEGYYRNDDAMRRTTRNGWYWSGDLAYVDDEGWAYFAGRTSDWLRVDGENFPAAPVEAIVGRHPDVTLAAVYGVPDPDSGDRVMAAVVLREGTAFDGASFAAWLDAQADLSPKWRPRFVRVCGSLPATPTNKILTRTLVHEKVRADRVGGDPLYVRDRGATAFRAFTSDDESALRTAFEKAGRLAAWDL